jgi:hypothetical protein
MKKFSLALPVLLLLASSLAAQTIDVEVLAPAMLILKIRPGLWQCQLEPCEVTLAFPDGTYDAIRVHRNADKNIATIPPTYVRGFLCRTVDPCEATGTFQDGSLFVCKLPREPVVVRGLTVVAVAIDCPTTIIRKNGEVWSGSVRFKDCIADKISSRERLARETTAYGKLTLQRR